MEIIEIENEKYSMNIPNKQIQQIVLRKVEAFGSISPEIYATKLTTKFDLLASFLEMKVPDGQNYVIKDLSQQEFEYKMVSEAFLKTL